MWGELGSATRVELRIYAGRPWDGTGSSAGCRAFEGIEFSENGSFEILVSPDEQDGNWLVNPREGTTIFVRHIYADWPDAVTGGVHIDRVGFEGKRKPQATASEIASRMRATSVMFGTTARPWPTFVARR